MRTFPAIILCILLAVAEARTAVIALDNISTNSLARFNLTGAALDERLQFTSIADNAVIPGNLVYPHIEWDAPVNYTTAFLLELTSPGHSLRVLLRDNHWQPQGDEFRLFLTGRELQVTLYRLERSATTKSRTARLRIAEPLEDRIIYRVVPPLFDVKADISLKSIAADHRGPDAVIGFHGACVGCHGYAPQTAVLNAQTKFTRKFFTAHQASNEFEFERHLIGEFSFVAISPDGRYAALVKDTPGKLVLSKNVIEPFEQVYKTGDICIYDFEKKTLNPLPGACDPTWVEDMPWFSADGKEIIFSRYKVVREGSREAVHSMDLCRVPFNNGHGGEAVPIPNASGNGLLQYFGRIAPNGKWVSFCRSNKPRGIFARQSSDIYLWSASDNSVRKLELNRDNAMDSWHDWSSDSRWLVFSSKRSSNHLTGLYLSYIDDNGISHPPVKLASEIGHKVNTPQFVPRQFDLSAVGGLKRLVETSFD